MTDVWTMSLTLLNSKRDKFCFQHVRKAFMGSIVWKRVEIAKVKQCVTMSMAIVLKGVKKALKTSSAKLVNIPLPDKHKNILSSFQKIKQFF